MLMLTIYTACPPNAAFGKESTSCAFTSGSCSALKAVAGTYVDYKPNGALFSIKAAGNAPTFESDKYIFFGKVEADVKPASGAGIVTSIVLQSADLDEIDWEWVGFDNGQAQSNYFSKGDDGTYDRGKFHPVANAVTASHRYGIDWTPERIEWTVDGSVVRTLSAAQAGGKFPQTPMQVKIGTWVGGDKNAAPGTIEWAGGLTDFSKGPFDALYKNVNIVDYAGGSTPTTKDVKEYVWTDKSGSAKSIKAVLNDGSSDSGDDSSSSSSSSAAKTTSKPTSTPASTSKTHSSTMSTASANSTTAANTTTPATSTRAATSAPAGTTGTNSGTQSAAALAAILAGLLAQLL